ncbi:TetR family transcriptional regulator [Niveibacterium umoris]|uniref:TetR/AcrR family acrAB operon transcriptional repressor n=1 Tax=Niveibacterium umoris TaxID=1193620 RepID=A0A840BDB9_9RHOO|nr:TetR family transcriptional regulator [Niveibacterium umoris]MBB4011085.1 TetR/AcrR family acrAB operon transcriptional repressor [Niveibacterium umoris]
MVRRTKEQAEATREQLLDAAETLFCEKGVASTTLDLIARAAGVTRGAVYWHFKNKAEIFEAVCDRATSPMETMLDTLAADPGEDPLGALERQARDILMMVATDTRMRSVLEILFRGFDGGAEFAEYLAREEENKRRCRCQIESVLKVAIARGQVSPKLDAADGAIALTAFVGGIMHDWVTDADYDLARLAPWLTEIFFRGLRHS